MGLVKSEGALGAQGKMFMEHALNMKRIAVEAGDQPYGAVVVKDGHIMGEGPSRVVTRQDPTAHAEMEAIRDAAKHLGTRDLGGCIIYVTSMPCRMCETAGYWANLSRIYFSDSVTDGGAPRYSSC
jgi:tRNA(Arg) A34 adenosine deaminase TadA